MMLLQLLCSAALVLAAHASSSNVRRLLQDSRVSPLLSADSTDVTGSTFEVEVTLNACPETPISTSDFTILPAQSAIPLQCTQGSTSQSSTCTFQVISTTHVHSIHVSTAETGSLAASNVLVFSYFPATYSAGKLVASNPYPDLTVTFDYFYDGAIKLADASKFEATIDGSDTYVQSLTTGNSAGTQMTWTVLAKEIGQTVTGVVKAGATYDMAGNMQSEDSEVVTIEISQPSNDCLVTSWSEWSVCSQQCTTFTTLNVAAEGVRTRSRSVRRPGAECPDLLETEACNTEPCFDSSLPKSGESLDDCAVISGVCAFNPSVTTTKLNCECSAGCEVTGNCCQSYYDKCCEAAGADCSAEVLENQLSSSDFPLACPASLCNSDTPVQSPTISSYFCYCDDQCVNDNQCCGGIIARNSVC